MSRRRRTLIGAVLPLGNDPELQRKKKNFNKHIALSLGHDPDLNVKKKKKNFNRLQFPCGFFSFLLSFSAFLHSRVRPSACDRFFLLFLLLRSSIGGVA